MAYTVLSTERFLQMVYELYFNAGKRFCFILGSGASRNSGIRTAPELMEEWLSELRQRYVSTVNEMAESVKLDDYQRFLSPDYKPISDDYFKVFELRFADMPDLAYKTLEREMSIDTGIEQTNTKEDNDEKEKQHVKFPSYGYLCLACLLADSENHYVITTNFDSMLEEALSVCRRTRPLVIGHESLAGFMDKHATRPVIMKVHRDLMYQPLNTSKEMEQLRDEWKEPLTSILMNSIPIVIGYAGADSTLMSFLENTSLEMVFWCGLEDKPSERVQKLLDNVQHGFWVKIDGFDETAYRLEKSFLNNEKYKAKRKEPTVFIENLSKHLLQRYTDQKEKLREAVEPNRRLEESVNLSKEMQTEMAAKANMYADLSTSTTRLYYSAYSAVLSGRDQEALDILAEIISVEPDNARYRNALGFVLHKMGHYDEALTEKTKAIELEPLNALYLDSRSATLHQMDRCREALKDSDRAVALEPDNAEYRYSRSVTLLKMGRLEEALKDSDRAEALEPDNAKYRNIRGLILHTMGRYDEALEEETKAIEQEPVNAQYYRSRSITLKALGKDAEAEADIKKAEELEKKKP